MIIDEKYLLKMGRRLFKTKEGQPQLFEMKFHCYVNTKSTALVTTVCS